MNIKLGLEVEFFGVSSGRLVNVGALGFPHDEYPLLAEARGEAASDTFQAVASVRGEIERITALMDEKNVIATFTNWEHRDAALEEEILREGYNKKIAYQNLVPTTKVSKKNEKFIAAGLHVSVTDEGVVSYKDDDKARTPRSYKINRCFDFPLMFNRITNEFRAEIKAAERIAGFYEVKCDGRVEYRSLPATLIHTKDFAVRLNRCIFPKK